MSSQAPPGDETDPLVHCLMQMAQADFSHRVPRTFTGDREDAVAYLVNTVAEELGRAVAELKQHHDQLESAVGSFAEVLAAHAAGNFEARAPRSMDGDPLDVLAFIINSTGEETGRLFEERNRAFEELEQQKETEAMVQARTAFLANVSHELRTPLTLILGPLQAVLRSPEGLGDRVRDELQIVLRNASRLSRMVNDLLDFTKAEEQRLEPRWQRIDAATLVREAVEDLQPVATARGLTLRAQVADDVTTIAADRRMFEKIVMNFLGNALKFTPSGGTVEATLRADGGEVYLAVSDTGIGIKPEDLERVFDRFLQVDSAQSRRFEGSGLGLALAREFARAMGGDAYVESEVGKGSTFTARLPIEGPDEGLAPEDVDPGVLENERWVRVAALDEAEERTSLNPVPAATEGDVSGYVLVAEDNADVQRYVRSVLSEAFEVHTVDDGLEALDAVSQRVPDVVVSDVMMPNMDGFELVRRLKAIPSLASVPIVLLTARAGTDAAIEGLDAGADDYLAKPFSPRELLARVRAAARLRRNAQLVLTMDELQASRNELLQTEKSAYATGLLADLGRELQEALDRGDTDHLQRLSGELVALNTASVDASDRFGLLQAVSETLGIEAAEGQAEVKTFGQRDHFAAALRTVAGSLSLDASAAKLRMDESPDGEMALVIEGGWPDDTIDELMARLDPPLVASAPSRRALEVVEARNVLARHGVSPALEPYQDSVRLRLELLFV